MPSVTKAQSGKYYEQDRLWAEARECGLPPFYIGWKWRGTYVVPQAPSVKVFKELADGKPLEHVQRNRIAVYDHTFSWDKSVTIATYGMTAPDKWGEWTKEFADIVKKVLEPRLDSQIAKTGAQGAVKEPSKGLALAFPGWRGAFGQLQAHVHGVVFNLTATKDGRAFSWGNPHESYRDQGLMRAMSNKLMDDLLRSRGIETVRKGRLVAVKGVPDDMVRALSPSRAAMDQAKAMKGKNGRQGPRAEDFAASKANRQGKKAGRAVTPKQAYESCQEIAKRYGVTPEKLRLTPVASNPSKEQYAAYEAALQARDTCTKRYGAFTEQQFLKWVYTYGIGREASFDTLTSSAKLVLRSKSFAGIEQTQTEDGHIRYFVPKGPEMSFGKDKAKTPQPDPAETAKEAERPFVREAWADLKTATKNLGGAVFCATAKKATDVIQRVTDVVNPPAQTLRLDGGNLDEFIVQHRRTHYAVAHLKAIAKGILAGGNPHRMAAAAEKAFANYRACERVRKNTVIVVERGDLATADQLRTLTRIAKRDRCSVILSERAQPDKAFQSKPRPTKRKTQALRRALREHGYRAGHDRLQ